MYLRIAPELYLKRLIVGGLERVYEMGRMFRNEGMDTKHNPEFSMIEMYQAYANYEDMMDLAENLICYVANEVLGTTEITYQGQAVSLKAPWRELQWLTPLKSMPALTLILQKMTRKQESFQNRQAFPLSLTAHGAKR